MMAISSAKENEFRNLLNTVIDEYGFEIEKIKPVEYQGIINDDHIEKASEVIKCLMAEIERVEENWVDEIRNLDDIR
jgi:hypothetical protein